METCSTFAVLIKKGNNGNKSKKLANLVSEKIKVKIQKNS